eukprot:15169979-Ditylum_brightwellii.AAC.1
MVHIASSVPRRDCSANSVVGHHQVKRHPGPRDFSTFSGFSLNVNIMKQDKKLKQICHQLANSSANFFACKKLGLRGTSTLLLRPPNPTPPSVFSSTTDKKTNHTTEDQVEWPSCSPRKGSKLGKTQARQSRYMDCSSMASPASLASLF